MLKVLKYHWRAILWIVVIIFASLMPGSSFPGVSFFSRIPHIDKIVHFAMYFLFSLFLLSGFSRQYGKTCFKAYAHSFLIAFVLGVSIEFVQEQVGRSYDIYDMAANTAGIVSSLLLFNPIKWVLRNIL